MTKISHNDSKPVESYDINYLWLSRTKQEDQASIFYDKNSEFNYQKFINPIVKHALANKEASINIWYDSTFHSKETIESTQKLFENECKNIYLKDLNDISFFTENHQILSEGPLYFRIDFCKLIILLHCLKTESKDASIFNDFTVGCINPDSVQPLNKSQYFDQKTLEKLKKSGLIVNICHYNSNKDSYTLPENQFLQMINDAHAVSTLEHLVNLNLIRAIDIFSRTEVEQKEITPHMHQIPFKSTIDEFYSIYEGIIKIRADVVQVGTKEEWITYNTKIHDIRFLCNHITAITVSGNKQAALSYNLQTNGITFNRGEIIEFNSSLISLKDMTRETYTRKGNYHVEEPIVLKLPEDHKYVFWDECIGNNEKYNIEASNSIQSLVVPNYLGTATENNDQVAISGYGNF